MSVKCLFHSRYYQSILCWTKAWNLDCINLSDLIISNATAYTRNVSYAYIRIHTHTYAVELKIRRRDSPRVENSSRSQKDWIKFHLSHVSRNFKSLSGGHNIALFTQSYLWLRRAWHSRLGKEWLISLLIKSLIKANRCWMVPAG